jgi:Sec-independent protein translocase protein TatA
VGFGTEILFILTLGLLVLGPKQLHTVLKHVARAKVELENATRGLKSQLAAELDAAPEISKTDCTHDSVEDRELCPKLESAPRSREPGEGALIGS